jgi:hypothetical protein
MTGRSAGRNFPTADIIPGRRFHREVRFDEGALIDGEGAGAFAVFALADDLGAKDAPPFICLFALAVERDEMLGLHGADRAFAFSREIETPAPVTPCAPGAECGVHTGVAADGVLRSAVEDAHAVASVAMHEELFIGLRRIVAMSVHSRQTHVIMSVVFERAR